MNKWIKVEDQLPQDFRKVIVWVYRYPHPCFMDVSTRQDGRWTSHNEGASTITHWMPLPAPPDKKGDC